MSKFPYTTHLSTVYARYVLPLAKSWLRDQTTLLFKDYKIEIEEYHSLNKLIDSDDPEILILAGEMVNRFFKRSKLYPPDGTDKRQVRQDI